MTVSVCLSEQRVSDPQVKEKLIKMLLKGSGVGDRLLMMENTWYTVISPENCSSILWRSWEKKEVSAEQLKLTSKDMQNFGLVDEIVPEPEGGAHWSYDEAAHMLKAAINP